MPGGGGGGLRGGLFTARAPTKTGYVFAIDSEKSTALEQGVPAAYYSVV